MLNKYIDYVFSNVGHIPDPGPDVRRFSTLHSWYKHFGENKLEIAYPILLRGEEPRNEIEPLFSDENQENFHWRFILESDFDEYKIRLDDDDDYVVIPSDICDLMKRTPIYLNRDLGYGMTNNFQIQICCHAAETFWNNLKCLDDIKCD